MAGLKFIVVFIFGVAAMTTRSQNVDEETCENCMTFNINGPSDLEKLEDFIAEQSKKGNIVSIETTVNEVTDTPDPTSRSPIRTCEATTAKKNLCSESMLRAPVNGNKSCSNANVLGSECRFTCERYHTRTGPARSTCIDNPQGPRWSHTTPTCEPDRCQPSWESLRHGELSCTGDNFVNSVCTFTCTDPGYSLYPAGVDINRCLSSQEWSQPAPCCTRPCPPNARMDAFIVLDSSSSVGAENWEIMKGFIRGILASFTISPDTTHFAIIRYNRRVDSGNQITLNDYTSDKDGLLAAFDRLPYDGSGTRTGQAIKYVDDVLMTPENGDRPDVPNVLVVVTDGKSQDGVLKPSEDLRKKGVITFAIGIQRPRGRLDPTQLNEIAGDPLNVLIADGFTKLDANFAIKITDKVCGDPCDN